jgi:hypothetical protein
MPVPVSYCLDNFPEEAEIIADLLLGFGDLEFLTISLIAEAITGRDYSVAARILYRLRGANDRLNVADALLRPTMNDLKLLGQYCQWLGAMRRCRVIRNQYAHCGWDQDSKGRLTFCDLEETGASVEGSAVLTYEPIELGLLKEQQAFFAYTYQLVLWLMNELRFRKDRRRRHKTRYPKSRAVPKLHSPRDG